MMKAVVYHGPGKRAWEDKRRATLHDAADAIVADYNLDDLRDRSSYSEGRSPSSYRWTHPGHEGIGVRSAYCRFAAPEVSPIVSEIAIPTGSGPRFKLHRHPPRFGCLILRPHLLEDGLEDHLDRRRDLLFFHDLESMNVCSVVVAAIMPPASPLWVRWVVLARNSIHRLLLGPLLNAAELVGPIALKGLHPIVNGLQLRRVQPVQPVLTALYDGHNAHLP
jgi:hypothetical protein